MILTTRQVSARIRTGKLPVSIDGGKVHCSKCGKILGDTESLIFWSKNSFVHCPKCNCDVLAQPHYPGGIVLDLSR
jgi:hypothetical protein